MSGKRYGVLREGGGGVLVIVTFVIEKVFVRLAVDIRLISWSAMPVFGYISTEFEGKRSEDFNMHQLSIQWRSKGMQTW